MATYFRHFRRGTTQHDEDDEIRTGPAPAAEADDPGSTSILIFPSPNSEAPSSPPALTTTLSSVSIPTSISFSPGGADPRSRTISSISQNTSVSPWEDIGLNGLEVELESVSDDPGSSVEVEVWAWNGDTTGTDDESQAAARESRSRALIVRRNLQRMHNVRDEELHQRFQFGASSRAESSSSFSSSQDLPKLISRHRARERTISQLSNTSTSTSVHAPHAPIHIPFISFVQNILCVDPSTVFLLTHSSPGSSSLFLPGTTPHDLIPIDPSESEEKPCLVDPGIKLLQQRDYDVNLLRRGLEMLPHSPFIVVSSPIEGFIGLIGMVVEGSGRAWRGVWESWMPAKAGLRGLRSAPAAATA